MRIVIVSLLAVACTSAPPPRGDVTPPSSTSTSRTPAVPKDSPHYDLFEGTSHKNDCTTDADCHVGGCSHEVCSAETRVMSSCIAHEDQPRDASCGCLAGECLWYR
jgi:eight-cysteine-cluster-containing protein